MFFFSSDVSNKDDNNHKNNSNDIITKDISQYQSWLDNDEFHKFTIENTTDGSLGLTKEFKSFIIENDNKSMNYGKNKSYKINKILEQLSMALSSPHKILIFTIKLEKWLCKKKHIIYDIRNYYNLIENNVAKYIDNIADIDDIKVHNDILNRENKFLDLSLKKNNKFYDLGHLDGIEKRTELIIHIKEQSKNYKYYTKNPININTIRNFINRCYNSLKDRKSPVIYSEMIELFHKYFNRIDVDNLLHNSQKNDVELLDICKIFYCFYNIANDFNSNEQSNSLEFFVEYTLLEDKIYNLLFIKDKNNIKYSSLLLEIIDYYNKKINVNSDEFTKNTPSKIHKYMEHLKKIREYQSWLDNNEFHKFTIENITDGSLGLTKEFKSFIMENNNILLNETKNNDKRIYKIIEQLSMELSSPYKILIFIIKLGKWLCKKKHIIYDIKDYYNLIENNVAKYIDNIADIDDIKVHNDILNRENNSLKLPLKVDSKLYDLGYLDGLKECTESLFFLNKALSRYKDLDSIIKTYCDFINRCYNSLEKKKSPVIHSEMIELFHKYFNKASISNFLHDLYYNNTELLDICKVFYCFYNIANDFPVIQYLYKIKYDWELVYYKSTINDTLLENKISNLLFIKDGNNIEYSPLLLEIIDHYNKKIDANSDEFTKNTPSRIHNYMKYMKKIIEYQSWLDNDEFHKFTIENTTDGALGLCKQFKEFICHNDEYLHSYSHKSKYDNEEKICKIIKKLSMELYSSPIKLCIFTIRLSKWIETKRKRGARGYTSSCGYDEIVIANMAKYIDSITDIDHMKAQNDIFYKENQTLESLLKTGEKLYHLKDLNMTKYSRSDNNIETQNILSEYIELIMNFMHQFGPSESINGKLYDKFIESIGNLVNRFYKSLENNKSTEIYTKMLEFFDKYFDELYVGNLLPLSNDKDDNKNNHDYDNDNNNDNNNNDDRIKKIYPLTDICKILYCFYNIANDFVKVNLTLDVVLLMNYYDITAFEFKRKYTILVNEILLSDNAYKLLFVKNGDNIQYTALASQILDYYKKKSSIDSEDSNCYLLVKNKLLEIKNNHITIKEMEKYQSWLNNEEFDKFTVENTTDCSLELKQSFKRFIMNNDANMYDIDCKSDKSDKINKILEKLSMELSSSPHKLCIFTLRFGDWLYDTSKALLSQVNSYENLIEENIAKYINTIVDIDDIKRQDDIFEKQYNDLKLLNEQLESIYCDNFPFYLIDSPVSIRKCIEFIFNIRINCDNSVNYYNENNRKFYSYKEVTNAYVNLMNRCYKSLKKKKSQILYGEMIKLFDKYFQYIYITDFLPELEDNNNNNNNNSYLQDLKTLDEWKILYCFYIINSNFIFCKSAERMKYYYCDDSEKKKNMVYYNKSKEDFINLINNILLGDIAYKLLFIKDKNDIKYTLLTSQILDYYKNISNESYEIVYKKLLEIKEYHSKKK